MNINGIELTVLESTGVYDYSWSEFALMRGNDGYLYVGSASGCSCNYFEENLTEVQRVKSWHEAADKAVEWARTDAYDAEEKRAGVELAERLMRSQPAAFDPSAVTAGGQD